MSGLEILRKFAAPVALGLVALLVFSSVAWADPLDPAQIKAVLHTDTAEEDGFIDRTVTMVNNETLPRDLFASCLIWARKKPRHKFQYFKSALIARAAEKGIQLK